MTMQYIRNYYKVPAKRGAKIKYHGQPYVIVGSLGHYLRVTASGRSGRSLLGSVITIHPTWEVEYDDA